MSIRTTILLSCAVFSASLFAAPADTLTVRCAECHGATGVSPLDKTPHLNGQLADYLEEDISGIANGARVTGIPDHIPKNWTRLEVAAVSKFYASSKAARPAQATDPVLVAKGEGLYKKRCANCHPNNGRESDHDAPLMAAQNLDYMMEQTRAFVSGKRKFVFMMDDAFRGLSATDLDSITHFFASQAQFKK